jgi:phage gp36-like protein
MPYCTQNDLETLIPEVELAELTNESGDIPNSTIITEMINLVDAEIDSYISVSYSMPLTQTPEIIKGLSMDMVIYHLYSRRSTIPLVRRTKYEAAIKLLQKVAQGNLNITGKDGYEIKLKSKYLIKIKSNKRIFTRSY